MTLFSRVTRVVALHIIIAMVSASASVRPQGPPDVVTCGRDRFLVDDVFSDWGAYRRNLLRIDARDSPKPSFNVLALSAGGQYGACGVGFLGGWGAVGDAAVPGTRRDIQIVTGFSTGAILTTRAFLGLDAQIEAEYRALPGSTSYEACNVFALLRANSLLDAAGKDALVEDKLSTDIIDRAAVAPAGRFPYICGRRPTTRPQREFQRACLGKRT